MADYIDKNILSQAYIHVEPTRLKTDEQLDEFKRRIEEFARTRSDFYLYPEVNIETDFSDGSLKARVTVMGSILLLIEGVSNYPDFREGVSLLYSDSKRLAEYVVSEAQFLAGAKHEDVIRLEARTGIIGSLHKLILKLEQIRRGADGLLSASELSVRISEVSKEITELIARIKEPTDVKVVENGLFGIVRGIPKKPQDPKDGRNSEEAIVTYQNRRRALRDIVKGEK